MDKKAKKGRTLQTEGWKKMATYSEPRLGEMVEEYRDLGFEVRLEDAVADEECAECYKDEPGEMKTIYVRKKGGRGRD